MLYLVGGCGRSGKSTLAERMRQRHGVPWFPLDALKMGLHHGAPNLGVEPGDDDMETADRMWPIVKGLIEDLAWDGRDYLVEGVNLRPASVAAYMADAPQTRASFLGYPGLTPQAKLPHVVRAASPAPDWLMKHGESYALTYLTQCQQLSAELRDACATVGLPFFDTGADYEGALAAAEQALTAR
jgi:predicted kinase